MLDMRNENMVDKGCNMTGKLCKRLGCYLKKIYFKATEFHFEKREELNGVHPNFEEVSSVNSEWILLDKSMSIFHDNRLGKNEMKFVHPSGREAVFDGDTLQPIMDPRFKATFNYVTPINIPENKFNLIGWIKFFAKGIGHLLIDVLPFYLTGKRNVRK